MKILMPVEVFYPSQAGGAASSVYYLVKNLDREQFQIKVISNDNGIPSDVQRNRWVDLPQGQVQYAQTRNPFFPVRATLSSLASIRWAEVVHASSIFYPSVFVSVLAARVLKKKF